MSQQEKLYIYVLELVNNKYFVGKTNNLRLKLNEHNESRGIEWTKIHEPLHVLYIYESSNSFDELKTTLSMMRYAEINDVRGANFNEVKLRKDQITMIEEMLNSVPNCCTYRGSSKHSFVNCDISINSYKYEFKKTKLSEQKSLIDSSKVKCHRCMRIGHYDTYCWAKRCINGNTLPPREESEDYKNKMKANGNKIFYDGKIKCRNCGGIGHYDTRCNISDGFRMDQYVSDYDSAESEYTEPEKDNKSGYFW
jgi:predicted GIY-YIG superfamily endonuclease